MLKRRIPTRSVLAAAVAAACAGGAQAADTAIGLGTLPGHFDSWAYGVSADGAVVVGQSTNHVRAYAFRWTSSGMQQIVNTLGGQDSRAWGVSADGSVVVGDADTAWQNRAFRWTSGGGMISLGVLSGSGNSSAYGVSADGSVVVGESDRLAGGNHAFRWVSGATGGVAGNPQMYDLGVLGTGAFSVAYGVSADGAVVVGDSDTGAGNGHAFRWEGGVMSDIHTLAGVAHSRAYAASANGGVVVGISWDDWNSRHAFRWTSGGGMQELSTLGGSASWANGVSADGSVVVGGSMLAGDADQRAFRWTQSGGMQSVADWLAAAGVAVPAGMALTDATAVNADGTVIVGYGANASSHTEAWLARVTPPGGTVPGSTPSGNPVLGSGLINVNAFNATVIEAGARSAQAGAEMPNLALFGAHHRSLLDAGLARTKDGACAWATADAARYEATDTRATLAEAGLCKDINSLRLGAGVGQAWSQQGWSLGGKAEYDGQYLVAEIANAFGGGLEASLTGYYGRFDADLHRNYRNGAAVDTSVGKTDAASAAMRARLDWKNAFQAGALSLTPYAAYTHIRTKLDAYTETGGGFPVAYGAAKWKSNDLRVGLSGTTALSAATSLRLAGELAHRFDDSTDGVKGRVLGLWGFALPGRKVKQDWVRATLDVDRRLSANSLLSFGANLATQGGDPSWGLTVGYRASF